MVGLTYLGGARVVPHYGGGMSTAKAALEIDAKQLAHNVGGNGVRFEGRFSRTSRLQPGNYTVAITAINGAGQSAAAQPLRFAVVK